jgi:hypothetical protein
VTHEHPSTPPSRRRHIHHPKRARRASLGRFIRSVSRFDRRAHFGVSAALGLAVLSAGLVTSASASTGTATAQAAGTRVVATATAAPTATATRTATAVRPPATPAVVASAQIALNRAERLVRESRTVAAKERKRIAAQSDALRDLMLGRADAAAASRAGEREPLESRRVGDKAVQPAKDAGTAAESTDGMVKDAEKDAASGTATPKAPAADAGVSGEGPLTAALDVAPGARWTGDAPDLTIPSLPAQAPQSPAVVEPVQTTRTPEPSAAEADTGALPVSGAATTEQVKRATKTLTGLVRDAKAVAVKIQPAPDTPREVLGAQASEARKAARELAKLARSLEGHRNGRIPVGNLCRLSFAPGETLRCDAAQQVDRLDNAFRARFGRHLEINDSYRSYEAQVATAASRGYLAAVPGYSNHGWAVALDLGGGVQQFGTAEHQWLREHGPAFGWDNPGWARANGRKPEAWHWEYHGR